MKCPYCAHTENQVVETRASEDDLSVRRRRRCEHCQRRFTTYEYVDVQLPSVIKKDGSRQEFDAHKLRASMQLALRKRLVSVNNVDKAVNNVKERAVTSGQREISTNQLGEWVLLELKQLDPVAFVRFASVYRSFNDLNEFKSLMDEIKVSD